MSSAKLGVKFNDTGRQFQNVRVFSIWMCPTSYPRAPLAIHVRYKIRYLSRLIQYFLEVISSTTVGLLGDDIAKCSVVSDQVFAVQRDRYI